MKQMKKQEPGKKRGRPPKQKFPDGSILNRKMPKIISGDSCHASKHVNDLEPYLQEFMDSYILIGFVDGELEIRPSPNFSQAQNTLAYCKVLMDFAIALNESVNGGGMEDGPPEGWMEDEE